MSACATSGRFNCCFHPFRKTPVPVEERCARELAGVTNHMLDQGVFIDRIEKATLVKRSIVLQPTSNLQGRAPSNRGSNSRSAKGAVHSVPVPKHIAIRSTASDRISKGPAARAQAAGSRRVWAAGDR